MEHGHLVREHTQPNRVAILEEVKARRNDPEGVIDIPGLGRCALTIPQLDFQRIVRDRPDLISADGHTSTKAWQKFMKHSDSEPYRNVRRI